jgi:hypothetical protein
MAKKDSNKKKKDEEPADLVETIRSTIERTFHAYAEGAQPIGERTRQVIDEVAAAASRIRQTMEEARVADEVRGLRREVEALAQRVTALESAKPAPTTRRTSSSRSSASRSSSRPAAGSTAKPSSARSGSRTRRSSSSSSSASDSGSSSS